MSRFISPLTIIALLLPGLGLAAGSEASSHPVRHAAITTHGLVEPRQAAQEQTLIHDGRERHYVLRLPAAWRPGQALLPLVVVLHGGGGNARLTEAMTGFTAKGASEGFAVVYPEGSGGRNDGLLTWNAGHCCGWALEHHVDDVGFIAALLDHLLATSPIDPQRLYITGMSNGAMLTHRLGIALAERIAAIAPVVGAVFGDEKAPAQPVSALMINGLLDESVPFAGGPPGGRATRAWDGTPTQPVLEQGAFWAGADGCTGATVREDHGGYGLWRHTCPPGVAVMQIVVNDGGHAWPGGQRGSPRGDQPSSAIDATAVIWDFFKATGAKRQATMAGP